MAEDNPARERAKRLLAKITAELTAWGPPAEPSLAFHDEDAHWAWRDGGEERALDAIEEALSEGPSELSEIEKIAIRNGHIDEERIRKENATRQQLDRRIESQRLTAQGLHRSYELTSRALARLRKGWAAFCIEVLWAERLGRQLSRDAWVEESVAELVRPYSPLEVEVCERCGSRAPCLPARRPSTEQRVCAWGCPEVHREEQSGAITMERLTSLHASAYVPLDPQPTEEEGSGLGDRGSGAEGGEA